MMNALDRIDQLFFDVIKAQTKALYTKPQGDELRITISHRLL